MASSSGGTSPMKLRVPMSVVGDLKESFSSQNLPCIVAKDSEGNEITIKATPGEDYFEFILPENTSGGNQQIKITIPKGKKTKKKSKPVKPYTGQRRGRPPKSVSLPPNYESDLGENHQQDDRTPTAEEHPESSNLTRGTEITELGIRRSRRQVKIKTDDDFITGYSALKKIKSEISKDGNQDDNDGISDDDDDEDHDPDVEFTSPSIPPELAQSDVAFSFNSSENTLMSDVSLERFLDGKHEQQSVTTGSMVKRIPYRPKKYKTAKVHTTTSTTTSRGTLRKRSAPGPVLTDPELIELLETVEPTETLEDHYTQQTVGRTGIWHECKHCKTMKKTKKDFMEHLRMHTKFAPWKCPKCSYAAPYKSVLASHLNTHSSVYPFICKLCGNGFHYKQKLKIHMACHTSDATLQHCTECDLTFTNSQKLMNHMSEVHSISAMLGTAGESEVASHNLKAQLSVGLRIDKELLDVCDLVKGAKKNALLSCRQCNFMCKSQTAFVSHLNRLHPEIRPYQCTSCPYRARTKHACVVHMKNHVDIKPHECHICGKSYAQKYKLDAHMKGHDNKREYTCNECPKAFNTKDELSKHFKNVHVTDQPFVCEICGKRFKFKPHYNSHMITHTGVKPFVCEVCNKCFSSRPSLMNHIKNHQTQYMCEICNKALGSHSGFMAHKRFHDPKNAEQCTCPDCGKLLQSRSGLARHRWVMHTNERPHECQLCKRKFKLHVQLQNHMISHSTTKAFKCPICGLRLKRKESLRTHMFCHAAVKPYKCGRCGQEYVQKKSLEIHLRVKHAGVKERCSFCGKGFNTKYLLINHIKRKHEGQIEQPVTEEPTSEVTVESEGVIAAACEQCKQVFLSQHSLAVHILTEHMNQKWVGGFDLSVQEDDLVIKTASSTELVQQEVCTSVAETIEIPCGEEMILISTVPGGESQVVTDESYAVTIDVDQ